ncbi:thymidine phosphorylase, partial [Pseudomonadota bacterium]
VEHDIDSIYKIVRKIKGCIVWGGGVNLAPSDDQIIRLERPLSIDAPSQLLASVIAKKASVSSSHLLVDIPFGKNSKCPTKKNAVNLSNNFIKLAHKFGIKTEVMLSDGSHPIGNGIGPALEAIDIMKVLHNDPDAPRGVRTKALYMAGLLFELTKKAKRGEGIRLALKTLISGKALKKMNEIIDAQGRKVKDYTKIKVGKYRHDVLSDKRGKVNEINNILISRLARLAGAPDDYGAGVYLHKHVNDKIVKGEKIFTIYADSLVNLKEAKAFAEESKLYVY